VPKVSFCFRGEAAIVVRHEKKNPLAPRVSFPRSITAKIGIGRGVASEAT